MTKFTKTITLLFAILSIMPAIAQEKMIDEVAAVVGDNIILFSDIESQYMQYRMQGKIAGGSAIRCQILEDMLFQKLLLHQAEIDSVEVSESQVESTMDNRMRYYIAQFGSQEKLEEFYKKSVLEIKDELRTSVREQLRGDNVRNTIVGSLKITPAEVKKFFSQLSSDSIPDVGTEYEIGQIVKIPEVSIGEKLATREKLKTLRERIINGENFTSLAVLYSEDPGSASKGGELGFHGRGELYPPFEAVAFSLKNKGDLSELVETQAGFHIIQLIERRGDYINCRHILLRPKVDPYALTKARMTLDSIATQIKADSITFNAAALKYSEDPGKINGGLLINPYTSNTKFEADQLDPKVFFTADNLEVGEVSNPVSFVDEENNEGYRLLYLKSKTSPHKANIKDDYNRLQEIALEKKKIKVLNNWIDNQVSKTYIKINPKYAQCTFNHTWTKQAQ